MGKQVFLVHNAANVLQEWQGEFLSAYAGAQLQLFDDPMLAIRECTRTAPDRVFAACSMRPMDGFAVLRMLRQRYPQIPVCLIGETEQDRRDAGNLLSDGYLQPPVTREKLDAFEKEYRHLRTAEAEEWARG